MTLINIIQESAKKYGSKKAFSMRMGYRNYDFTFTQIYELAQQTALFLQAQGVKKGDKVVIFAPNSPYWVALFFGCIFIGAIPLAINVQSPIDQVNKIIAQTEASVIFVNPFFKDLFPGLKVFVLDYLPDLVRSFAVQQFVPADVHEDDILQILYTSGTTGDPKGVMLTHKNICSNLESISTLINVDLEHDRLLSILPLSHIFEQMVGLYLPFSHGVHVIYAHSYAAIADLMQEYHITKIGAVPEFLQVFMTRIENAVHESRCKTMFFTNAMRIASVFNNYTISRFLFYPFLKKIGGKLDTIACGGAFLDPHLEKKWEAMGIQILQGYGLTETSPCVTTNTFDDHRFASVGKVVGGVDVRIAPDKEILVKGPNVFKGYYKNPEKTKEVFTHDGYFMTGDMGEFDDDGFLFIKGRKKYMILSSGGQNVYPEDIEMELNKCEGVKDSCVVGIGYDGRVEIHGVVLLQPDAHVDVKQIINQANANLASYQRINAWSIWPDVDFPRTVTRKVKKNDIIAWIESKQTSVSTAAQQTRLMTILAQISGISAAKIDQKTKIIEDLNLDSLMRVELIVWIEQEFGASIDETDITADLTVDELDQLIKIKKGQAARKPKLKTWPRSFLARVIRALLQPLLFMIFKIFVRIKVEGIENLHNLEHPLIFMPNHVSYVDGIIFSMALPYKFRRKISFAAAKDVLYDQYGYVAYIAELLFNAFPIGRGDQKNIKLGLEFIGKMIDSDYSVVIFPEGHISQTGSLQTFQLGSGLIAVEMGVEVIPVLMEGVQEIFPYDKFLPVKRGTITVKFLKPLSFAKTESYQEAEQRLVNEVAAAKK